MLTWTDEEGREAGMMMRLHKDQMRPVLNALSFYSKQPLYADSDDRSWLAEKGISATLDVEVSGVEE